jgi:hypothetical protein
MGGSELGGSEQGRSEAAHDVGAVVVTHADQQLLLESMAALKKNGPVSNSKKIPSPALVLRRQTHLHLQSRRLVGYLAGSLDELVPHVQVAFLQDNELTHVPAISNLSNLTMLYLQV